MGAYMSKSSDDRYSVTVYLPPKIHEIVTEKLKGSLGKKDSEIVRNIIIIYLAERGLLRESKYFIGMRKKENDGKH